MDAKKQLGMLLAFLAGAVLMGVLGGLALLNVNSGWERTVENHKKLERILMDRIELRDRKDLAAARENVTVKTVLLEDPYQGAVRAAWTIAGRVEPHTDNGRADAYYGYLDSTGHIDAWRRASRDEAPNVLDVTMGPVPPAPPAPAVDAGGAATAQRIIEMLKAAQGGGR